MSEYPRVFSILVVVGQLQVKGWQASVWLFTAISQAHPALYHGSFSS